jgi:hypothetical protein
VIFASFVADPCGTLFFMLLVSAIGLKALLAQTRTLSAQYPHASQLAGQGLLALLKKFFG